MGVMEVSNAQKFMYVYNLFFFFFAFLIQIKDIVGEKSQTKCVLEYIDFPDEGKVQLMYVILWMSKRGKAMNILSHLLMTIQDLDMHT